jgi:hypothetical protein
MRKIQIAAWLALVLFAGVGSGYADTLGSVGVTFQGALGGPVSVLVDRPDLGLDTTVHTRTGVAVHPLEVDTEAGPMQVSLSNPLGTNGLPGGPALNLPNPQFAFCMDLYKPAVLNQTETYQIVSLTEAPIPGPTSKLTISANQAALIGSLFQNDYALAIAHTTSNKGVVTLTNPEAAEAFTAALWELVYDTGLNVTAFGGVDGPGTGFLAGPYNGQTYGFGYDPNALTLANTWLSKLNPNNTASVVALVNPTTQDFALMLGSSGPIGPNHPRVPEPTGVVALLGLALMGLVAVRRGRKR